MPSRYEPGGLNQIYSLKYGTVPVVRATGGLDDTIDEQPNGLGNGFKFWGYNTADLLDALRRALTAFRNKGRMDCDHEARHGPGLLLDQTRRRVRPRLRASHPEPELEENRHIKTRRLRSKQEQASGTSPGNKPCLLSGMRRAAATALLTLKLPVLTSEPAEAPIVPKFLSSRKGLWKFCKIPITNQIIYLKSWRISD